MESLNGQGKRQRGDENGVDQASKRQKLDSLIPGMARDAPLPAESSAVAASAPQDDEVHEQEAEADFEEYEKLKGEILELEKEIADSRARHDSTPNILYRRKQVEKIEWLTAELEPKKRQLAMMPEPPYSRESSPECEDQEQMTSHMLTPAPSTKTSLAQEGHEATPLSKDGTFITTPVQLPTPIDPPSTAASSSSSQRDGTSAMEDIDAGGDTKNFEDDKDHGPEPTFISASNMEHINPEKPEIDDIDEDDDLFGDNVLPEHEDPSTTIADIDMGHGNEIPAMDKKNGMDDLIANVEHVEHEGPLTPASNIALLSSAQTAMVHEEDHNAMIKDHELPQQGVPVTSTSNTVHAKEEVVAKTADENISLGDNVPTQLDLSSISTPDVLQSDSNPPKDPAEPAPEPMKAKNLSEDELFDSIVNSEEFQQEPKDFYIPEGGVSEENNDGRYDYHDYHQFINPVSTNIDEMMAMVYSKPVADSETGGNEEIGQTPVGYDFDGLMAKVFSKFAEDSETEGNIEPPVMPTIEEVPEGEEIRQSAPEAITAPENHDVAQKNINSSNDCHESDSDSEAGSDFDKLWGDAVGESEDEGTGGNIEPPVISTVQKATEAKDLPQASLGPITASGDQGPVQEAFITGNGSGQRGNNCDEPDSDDDFMTALILDELEKDEPKGNIEPPAIAPIQEVSDGEEIAQPPLGPMKATGNDIQNLNPKNPGKETLSISNAPSSAVHNNVSSMRPVAKDHQDSATRAKAKNGRQAKNSQKAKNGQKRKRDNQDREEVWRDKLAKTTPYGMQPLQEDSNITNVALIGSPPSSQSVQSPQIPAQHAFLPYGTLPHGYSQYPAHPQFQPQNAPQQPLPGQYPPPQQGYPQPLPPQLFSRQLQHQQLPSDYGTVKNPMVISNKDPVETSQPLMVMTAEPSRSIKDPKQPTVDSDYDWTVETQASSAEQEKKKLPPREWELPEWKSKFEKAREEEKGITGPGRGTAISHTKANALERELGTGRASKYNWMSHELQVQDEDRKKRALEESMQEPKKRKRGTKGASSNAPSAIPPTALTENSPMAPVTTLVWAHAAIPRMAPAVSPSTVPSANSPMAQAASTPIAPLATPSLAQSVITPVGPIAGTPISRAGIPPIAQPANSRTGRSAITQMGQLPTPQMAHVQNPQMAQVPPPPMLRAVNPHMGPGMNHPAGPVGTYSMAGFANAINAPTTNPPLPLSAYGRNNPIARALRAAAPTAPAPAVAPAPAPPAPASAPIDLEAQRQEQIKYDEWLNRTPRDPTDPIWDISPQGGYEYKDFRSWAKFNDKTGNEARFRCAHKCANVCKHTCCLEGLTVEQKVEAETRRKKDQARAAKRKAAGIAPKPKKK